MSAERKPMPKMVERQCKRCKKPFFARAADVKRGWGLFCSKSCKAIKREQRTGQCRAYWDRQDAHANWDGVETFSNAHQFSNEEHDCNKE
ncbi:MAG: hypothetical protein VB131_04180 [Burkholderia gladioli]